MKKAIFLTLTILLFISSQSINAQKDTTKNHKLQVEFQIPEYNAKSFAPNLYYYLKDWLAPYIGFRTMYGGKSYYRNKNWHNQIKTGIKFYPYGEKRRIVFSHHLYYAYYWYNTKFGERDQNFVLTGVTFELKLLDKLFSGISFDLGYGKDNHPGIKNYNLKGDLYFNIRYKLF